MKSVIKISYLIFCLNFALSISCSHKNSTEPDIEYNIWIPINNGLTNLYIQSLTVASQESNILYVSSYDGIFKSIDGGNSWKISNTDMTSNDIKTICCNENDNNILLAGSWGGGIFLSEDAANSWKRVINGISDLRIWAIISDPANINRIFAVSETKLIISLDKGMNWIEKNCPGGTFRSFNIDFQNNLLFVGTAFDGMFRSNNTGLSYESINQGIFQSSYNNIISLQIVRNSIWAAINSQGVYLSQDNGQNWQPFNNGLTIPTIQCMQVNDNNPDFAIVGTKYGVFMTINGAKSWTQINDGLTFLDVRALAIDPKDSRIIYAGTMGGGIFKMILE